MNVPKGNFQIQAYWEFFDFPRYLLASDADGHLWIFEGSFDDELDDYPDSFIYCRVPVDWDAMETFRTRRLIPLGADRSKHPSINLSQVEFDETARRSFTVA